MAQPGRGHYKIFLGMAAGVGKTYRMLQEGQAEKADGRDVVVGILETHGARGHRSAGGGARGHPAAPGRVPRERPR